MTEENAEPQPAVIVPHAELSAAALHGVIESFVLREGTEYGATDIALAAKVAQVMRQLERGEANIMFDPESDSINIVLVKD